MDLGASARVFRKEGRQSGGAEALNAACGRAGKEVLQTRFTRNRAGVYWWSKEIAVCRCFAARRILTSNRTSHNEEAYKQQKCTLRSEIKASRRMHWRKLAEEVESNPWGEAYRIVTNRMCMRSGVAPSLEEGGGGGVPGGKGARSEGGGKTCRGGCLGGGAGCGGRDS